MATELSRMGFVLAGGKSSRMGPTVDKAFLDFRGQTLLDRALGVMGAACGRVAIVGDPAKFAKAGSVIADIFPGCGPLGGVHAALVHSLAELNLMLAVDMPFVSSELLAFLFDVAAGEDEVRPSRRLDWNSAGTRHRAGGPWRSQELTRLCSSELTHLGDGIGGRAVAIEADGGGIVRAEALRLY